MDWESTQAVIVPALTVLFQALKMIPAVEQKKEYISLAAVLLGAVTTVLWTLALGLTGSAVLAEAVLRGLWYGAGSVALYEVGKAVKTYVARSLKGTT